MVIESYNNNFLYPTNTPAGLTAQDAVNDYMIAVKKARYWGITPIVLNMSASKNATTADQVARQAEFGALLEAACAAQDPPVLYGDFIPRFRFNKFWANKYDLSGSEGYYNVTGGLPSDVHPGTVGYKAIGSLVADIIAGKQNTYTLTQAGTSAVADKCGVGTTAYPLSIACLNNQSVSGDSGVDLATGVYGKTIHGGTGTYTTPIDTPSAGTPSAKFILRGGVWPAGNVIDQPYWNWRYSVIKCSSGDGINVSAANDYLSNLTIVGCANGVTHSQDVTVKNTIFSGTTTDINSTGGTATVSNNIPHTVDPKFVDPDNGDYRIQSSSPAVNQGTVVP